MTVCVLCVCISMVISKYLTANQARDSDSPRVQLMQPGIVEEVNATATATTAATAAASGSPAATVTRRHSDVKAVTVLNPLASSLPQAAADDAKSGSITSSV